MATKITTPELFNLSSNNTAATQLPVFTTSTRPTPTTSTVQVEYLVIGGGGAGGAWGGGGGAGGYLTNYGGSKTPLTSSVNYAIVVGEGGIKQADSGSTIAANAGEDSSIIGTGISVVANGGGGGGVLISGSTTTEYPAQNGGSGGGASSMRNASVGGSGNTPSTTPSQGNDGGDSPAQDPNYPGGGGGGGAGSPGGDGQNSSGNYSPGNGGNGLASSITGTSVTRAGGGGGFLYGGPNIATDGGISAGGTGGGGAGGRYVSPSNGSLSSFSNAIDGEVNTGSGGGSGSANPYQSGSIKYGGSTASGGSGIVILRYPTSSSLNIKTTGSLVYTESTDGSDTVIQFTEGSGNISFASAGIAVGEMIFNSTTEKVEYWDGFQWNMIKDEAIIPPLSTTDPFGDGSQLALYQFNGNANNTNGTNNGIVSGSGGYTTGKFGQAINITGATTSYVYSLKPPAFNQSMCFWVDFSNINFNADKTFYLNTGGSSYFYWWYYALFYQLSSDKFYFGAYSRNSSANYNYRGTGYTLTNLNKTGWNFIVATYPSGGNATYSINNSIIATVPLTAGQSGNITTLVADNQIGRVYSNAAYFSTNGPIAIDQYRLFNKTLSQSEINTLYTEVV